MNSQEKVLSGLKDAKIKALPSGVSVNALMRYCDLSEQDVRTTLTALRIEGLVEHDPADMGNRKFRITTLGMKCMTQDSSV